VLDSTGETSGTIRQSMSNTMWFIIMVQRMFVFNQVKMTNLILRLYTGIYLQAQATQVTQE